MERNRYSLVAVALIAGCSDLPDVTAGVCGNQVIEPERGEDCDVLTDPAAGPNLTCNAECHYTCDPAAPSCPQGWGCGLDGVCRHGIASFTATPEVVADELPSAVLATGDVDGDHASDVIAADNDDLAILYRPRRDSTQAPFPVPAFAGAHGLAVLDVDRDGRADVIRSTSRGFLGIAGSPDRTTSRPLLAVELLPPSADDEPGGRVVFLDNRADALLPQRDGTVAVVDLTSMAPTPRAFAAGSGALSAPAVFHKNGQTRIAVVRENDRHLYLDGTSMAPLLDGAPLGPPLVLDPGPVSPEIVVPVQMSGSPLVDRVSPGSSPTVDSTLDPNEVIQPGPGPCPAGLQTGSRGTPIAVADFGWVTTTSVLWCDDGAGPSPKKTTTCCRAGGIEPRISQAVVLDRNGDGASDVAWIADEDRVLLEMQRAPGVFEHGSVPLTRHPEALYAVRLTSDDDDDILVRERVDDSTSQLEIIYGQTDESPEQPRFAVTVPGLSDVAVDVLPPPGGTSTSSIVVLGYDAGRYYRTQFAAPDELVSKIEPTIGMVGTGPATFIGVGATRGGGRDLVTVHATTSAGCMPAISPASLWVWPRQERYLSDDHPTPLDAGVVEAFEPTTLVDLDHDGIDELAIVDATQIRLFDLGSPSFARGQPVATGATEAPSSIDRVPTPSGDCVVAAWLEGPTPGAMLYCGADASTKIEVTTEPVIGVTHANVDDDPEPELIVVTPNAIEIYDVTSDHVTQIAHIEIAALTLPITSPLPCPSPPGPRPRRGHAAIATDLDGDGVADLVVTIDGTGYIFWGTPHTARQP